MVALLELVQWALILAPYAALGIGWAWVKGVARGARRDGD